MLEASASTFLKRLDMLCTPSNDSYKFTTVQSILMTVSNILTTVPNILTTVTNALSNGYKYLDYSSKIS